MAKQRVILDSLQSQIDLPVGQIDKLSNEELQKHVDEAVRKVNFLIFSLERWILKFYKKFYELFWNSIWNFFEKLMN